MSGLERVRRLMGRPGAWLDATPGGYALRLGGTRRTRISLMLDETTFRALIDRPGLAGRPGGGWIARRGASPGVADTAGRPGVQEGEKALIEPDGRIVRRCANLAQDPIAWLAGRRDPSGQPLLTPAEAAAGARLRLDAELAQRGASLTMRWDALPRSGAGSSSRPEPSGMALSAGRRTAAALAAVGPRLSPMLDAVCIRGTALQTAETGLGLRRRTGKLWLKQGLQALARHYGIG